MTEEINKVPTESPNFRTEAAIKLAELFPEAVADGKIDVDKVKEILGEDAGGGERFGLVWPGKRESIRAAQLPTTATLAPCRDDSVDWDTTQNVFIEGDNLEVLKILQKYYYGKIKMIYIDPPYNTGKDFVYSDNYADPIGSYLELTGQKDEQGRLTTTNRETEGRFHSNWLNMMYPRLKLARNLLTEDGAVFMSIDDSEFDKLMALANEIFGENNFVGTLVWAAGRKNDSKYISSSHEYILCFARNMSVLKEHHVTWKVRKTGLDDIYQAAQTALNKASKDYKLATSILKSWFKNLPDSHPAKRHKHYSNIDERGVFFPDNISWPGGGGPKYDVLHPVTHKPVQIPSRGWLYQEPRLLEMIAADRVHFGVDESNVPTLKRYLSETEYEVPYSVFYQDGRASTKRLSSLLGRKVFDFPKDETILSGLLQMVTSEDDLILDFFAGSATTAHAVMQLNAEDGGERQVIMVQLPEPTPEKSEARKAGYETISEISRERIRRAGKKIREDFAEKISDRERPLDTGFRAYKLTDTNFPRWSIKSDTPPEDLGDLLDELADSARDDATPEQLLSELLLKMGFSLSESIAVEEISGLEVFSISEGTVLAYVDEHVKPTLDQFRSLVAQYPAQLVVLEDCIKDDEIKTNLVQECQSHDVELWTA